jgi:hypothetical protein
MKYQKTLAVLAGLTFAGALSQAQIAIGENLTISGFVDASYVSEDNSSAGTDHDEIAVDEVEIDFKFSYDNLSAEVHLQSTDALMGSDLIEVEQAFISTGIGSITVSAGRMLNLLGFESDEATGLYQASNAYESNTLDDATRSYNEGIRGSYSQGDFAISASITDDLQGTTVGLGDADEVALDVLLSYNGIENLAIALGYSDEGDGDEEVVNLYATYLFGQFTIAGEYIDVDNTATAGDQDQYLILLNYTINDDLSVTGRYSEIDSNTKTENLEKSTVALNYSISDNLTTVIEYSSADVGAGATKASEDLLELQGIFTF